MLDRLSLTTEDENGADAFIAADIQYSYLGGILSHSYQLGTLQLVDVGLDDACVEELASVLAKHPTITSLDLSKNSIGPGGACTIASLLTQNYGIKRLCLSQNVIATTSTASTMTSAADSFAEEDTTGILAIVQAVAEQQSEKFPVVMAAPPPDIPVAHGPQMYWGLPGLVMEVKDGNSTIICSEVIMNPAEKVVINEPSKGKVISAAKYDVLVEEKMAEMEKMGAGGKKKGGGHMMKISVGG